MRPLSRTAGLQRSPSRLDTRPGRTKQLRKGRFVLRSPYPLRQTDLGIRTAPPPASDPPRSGRVCRCATTAGRAHVVKGAWEMATPQFDHSRVRRRTDANGFPPFCAAVLLAGLLTPALADECFQWVPACLAARHYPLLAYDSARHVVVAFGGYDTIARPSAETWEWNGVIWTYRGAVGPSGRYGQVLAYDSARCVRPVRRQERRRGAGRHLGVGRQRVDAVVPREPGPTLRTCRGFRRRPRARGHLRRSELHRLPRRYLRMERHRLGSARRDWAKPTPPRQHGVRCGSPGDRLVGWRRRHALVERRLGMERRRLDTPRGSLAAGP